MSIINDALKKTEQSIQKNENQHDIVVDKIKKRPFLVYFFILLAGISAGNLIFMLLKNKVLPQKPKVLSVSEKPAVKPIQTPVPVPTVEASEKNDQAQPAIEAPKKPDYILNGIFYSDNDGYALVNNQIVRENDSIDGARVVKITASSVQLDFEGSITTLTTKW